jgi:GDP-L-fucose synthase
LEAQGCTNVIVVRRRDYNLVREKDVARLFRDTHPNVVIHLAGLVGNIVSNNERPADFFYQNLIMGTLVVHYAWKFGVEKCVCTMSGAGYPANAPVPLKETSLWEGLPQPETAPYSLAKRMLHVQSDAYFRQFGFGCVVVIPGNAYGPYDNFELGDARVAGALVRRFVDAVDMGAEKVAVWGTGSATRDFIYAADLARGILLAAETYDRAELVNISSGLETSIAEVVRIIKDAARYRGQVIWDATQPDGQQRRWFDITKARCELGFQSTIGIDEGLYQTIAWYRRRRARSGPS